NVFKAKSVAVVEPLVELRFQCLQVMVRADAAKAGCFHCLAKIRCRAAVVTSRFHHAVPGSVYLRKRAREILGELVAHAVELSPDRRPQPLGPELRINGGACCRGPNCFQKISTRRAFHPYLPLSILNSHSFTSSPSHPRQRRCMEIVQFLVGSV